MMPGSGPEPDGGIRRGHARDAGRLYDIRRRAILAIDPAVMSRDLAIAWADVRALSWMGEMLASRDVRVFERATRPAGWISTIEDEIDGLYVDPACDRLGIGSRLLRFAEAEARRGGWTEIRLEASVNAHTFYRKRGYLPLGPPDRYGALPMVKPLDAAAAPAGPA